MDNFEHLLDGATILGKILQASSGVKILATSLTLGLVPVLKQWNIEI